MNCERLCHGHGKLVGLVTELPLKLRRKRFCAPASCSHQPLITQNSSGPLRLRPKPLHPKPLSRSHWVSFARPACRAAGHTPGRKPLGFTGPGSNPKCIRVYRVYGSSQYVASQIDLLPGLFRVQLGSFLRIELCAKPPIPRASSDAS